MIMVLAPYEEDSPAIRAINAEAARFYSLRIDQLF